MLLPAVETVALIRPGNAIVLSGCDVSPMSKLGFGRGVQEPSGLRVFENIASLPRRHHVHCVTNGFDDIQTLSGFSLPSSVADPPHCTASPNPGLLVLGLYRRLSMAMSRGSLHCFRATVAQLDLGRDVREKQILRRIRFWVVRSELLMQKHHNYKGNARQRFTGLTRRATSKNFLDKRIFLPGRDPGLRAHPIRQAL